MSPPRLNPCKEIGQPSFKYPGDILLRENEE